MPEAATETAHDRWVAEGNCPAVHRWGVWCGRRRGHHQMPDQRRHSAPLARPGGGMRWVEWDDVDNMPRDPYRALGEP